MAEKMLSVEVNRSYDVTSQEWNNEIFLKLYVSAFKSGLVNQLGAERFTTLLAIASFMDEKGHCYPTQDQIAERVGVSRRTVGKYIQELVDFRWEDKPLVLREKYRQKGAPHENSIYTVLPLSQVAIFGGTVAPMGNIEQTFGKSTTLPMGSSVPTNNNHITITNNNNIQANGNEEGEEIAHKANTVEKPVDLLNLWKKLYRDTYGVNCNVNYGRDMAMLNKLCKTNSVSHVADAITIVFQEYEDRWANGNYPRPTIGQLSSWLFDKAIAIKEDVEKERANMQKAIEVAEQLEEDEDKFDDILGKLGGGL